MTAAAFRGVAISGIVLQRERDPTTTQIQEWSFFGLDGMNQLVGGFEPEDLELIVWLTGFASAAAIETYMNGTLRPLVGKIGSLALTGSVTVTVTNLALRGVSTIEHDDQKGPLPNNPALPSAPWTDHARFRFRKLR